MNSEIAPERLLMSFPLENWRKNKMEVKMTFDLFNLENEGFKSNDKQLFYECSAAVRWWFYTFTALKKQKTWSKRVWMKYQVTINCFRCFSIHDNKLEHNTLVIFNSKEERHVFPTAPEGGVKAHALIGPISPLAQGGLRSHDPEHQLIPCLCHVWRHYRPLVTWCVQGHSVDVEA